MNEPGPLVFGAPTPDDVGSAVDDDLVPAGGQARGELLDGAALPARAAAPTIDTTARNALVIDYDTGATLLDKGADQRIPPASMSKTETWLSSLSRLASTQPAAPAPTIT